MAITAESIKKQFNAFFYNPFKLRRSTKNDQAHFFYVAGIRQLIASAVILTIGIISGTGPLIFFAGVIIGTTWLTYASKSETFRTSMAMAILALTVFSAITLFNIGSVFFLPYAVFAGMMLLDVPLVGLASKLTKAIQFPTTKGKYWQFVGLSTAIIIGASFFFASLLGATIPGAFAVGLLGLTAVAASFAKLATGSNEWKKTMKTPSRNAKMANWVFETLTSRGLLITVAGISLMSLSFAWAAIVALPVTVIGVAYLTFDRVLDPLSRVQPVKAVNINEDVSSTRSFIRNSGFGLMILGAAVATGFFNFTGSAAATWIWTFSALGVAIPAVAFMVGVVGFVALTVSFFAKMPVLKKSGTGKSSSENQKETPEPDLKSSTDSEQNTSNTKQDEPNPLSAHEQMFHENADMSDADDDNEVQVKQDQTALDA